MLGVLELGRVARGLIRHGARGLGRRAGIGGFGSSRRPTDEMQGLCQDLIQEASKGAVYNDERQGSQAIDESAGRRK